MHVLTDRELSSMDTLLHDDFPRQVEKDLHRFQGFGVLSAKGYWVITDRRTGKPMYGHC